MKSEKGLTFISTAILVVIIAALTFGVVYFVRLQLNKGKNEDIKTDMLLVESRVQKLSGEYILEKKEEEAFKLLLQKLLNLCPNTF